MQRASLTVRLGWKSFGRASALLAAILGLISLSAWRAPSQAAAAWEPPLSEMKLPAGVARLGRTNCVHVLLNAFQSNGVVKALIIMPGATDELCMFHRAEAVLTNASPSLLDAVTALTNQTLIRATFRPPFLLLHSDEDPLEPITQVVDERTAAKIRKARFKGHVVYEDQDWDRYCFRWREGTASGFIREPVLRAHGTSIGIVWLGGN